jgi:3-isopropylmalate dehydrogenase
MTTHRIAALAGDGIGPEVTAAGIDVLRAVGSFDITEHPIGAVAIDRMGVPLPDDTLAACTEADAVLLGAVGTGGPPPPAGAPRPEQGVLALRSGLGVYANLRPVRAVPTLSDIAPLRPELLAGVDLVVVRELTGGLYFGERGRRAKAAFDTCVYSTDEIARVTRLAFDLARSRGVRPRVASVDKANVLETSRLWREVVQDIADREYPDVTVEHVLVDTAAMWLVTQPRRFDVLLTENMFGDILSDAAAAVTGSIGLLPSASLPAAPRDGNGVRGGLFEPIHGSAPDIAGRGVANPLGMILSVALLLRYGLGLEAAAKAVDAAVERTLLDGPRTPDLGGVATTETVTRAVLERL